MNNVKRALGSTILGRLGRMPIYTDLKEDTIKNSGPLFYMSPLLSRAQHVVPGVGWGHISNFCLFFILWLTKRKCLSYGNKLSITSLFYHVLIFSLGIDIKKIKFINFLLLMP